MRNEDPWLPHTLTTAALRGHEELAHVLAGVAAGLLDDLDLRKQPMLGLVRFCHTEWDRYSDCEKKD